MINELAVIAAAYLIGALPHLVILARLHRIAPHGDLHMALWQQKGPAWGVLAISIDIGKGIIAVWLARWLGFDTVITVVCGLAAVGGQMWPVFKKFDGEKGNTTGAGAAAAITFWPTILALTPVILALLLKLYKASRLKDAPPGLRFKTGAGSSSFLPVGVAVCFLILPSLAWLHNEPPAVYCGFIALFGMIMLRRLTAGISQDLKSGTSRRRILWRRLLLDRGTIQR